MFKMAFLSVAVCLISTLFLPIVLAKKCEKIDSCKCEMDDGSGTISLWDLDNSDGTPRFKNIEEKDPTSIEYTYNYNPCTPIKSTGEDATCQGANLCQRDPSSIPPLYYPCDASDPTFTVDESNHVVMTYKTRTDGSYTRTSKITLVCDENNAKGSFGTGVTQTPGSGASSTYAATLTVKNACPVASSLSTGSILLIIFFPLVLLYLIIGILFNIYVRHQKSVPEVLPNHTFWANFPFLVKDGCIFSCGKLKYCCCVLYGKARGEKYQDI